MLYKEKQITGSGKKPKVIRRQHCFNCSTVLAIEVTDKLGFGGEYWWLDRGLWVQEKWFGKHVKCPKCGLEGNLPNMDKPLSYEDMEKNKEERKGNGN